MEDIFRPQQEPARSIYDAFKAEAKKRDRREVNEWIEAERNAVLYAAITAAKRMGLSVPTMSDVERAERNAYGHVDYGAKWAYGIVDAMYKSA